MHSPTVPLAYESLLLGVGASAALFAMFAVWLPRSRRTWPVGLLLAWLWSLVAIGLVTLLPLDPCRGAGCPDPSTWVSRPCHMEVYGSDLDSLRLRHGQLNLLLFLPSGVLVGLTALWPRRARLLVPSGLAVLAAYSILIELIQQELAGLRRACDLNDFIDNLAGAATGVALGLLLALLALWTTRRRGDSPLRLGPVSGRRRTQTTGTTPPSSTGSRQ